MVFKGQDLVTITRPYLEELAEVVDETVFLGIREYDTVKILDVIEAKKSLKISSPIGAKLPLTAGAVGKIFFSTMKNEDVISFLKEKGLPRYTDNSITDINTFIEEIEKTRKFGYSLDLGEYLKGIRAIAALVYQDKDPIGAIWFVGFSNSMIDERLQYIVHHLKHKAEQISARLSLNFQIEQE
jgi:DNA-binding IclR family transcriptional regulator